MSRNLPKHAFKYMVAVFLTLSAYSCAVVNESIVYEPEGSGSESRKAVSEKIGPNRTDNPSLSQTKAARHPEKAGHQGPKVSRIRKTAKADHLDSGIIGASDFQSEEVATAAEKEIKKVLPENALKKSEIAEPEPLEKEVKKSGSEKIAKKSEDIEPEALETEADEDCGCSKAGAGQKDLRKSSTIRDRMDAFGSMLLPSVFTESEDRPSEDDMIDPADEKFFSKYSKKWGIYFNGKENKDLIAAIAEWIGTPHRMGGCSKYGIDCSCLVKNIYKDVYGIDLNRSSSSIYYNDLIPVKKENLKEGDIVCFNIRGRRISHIGIYLKNNKFVHSSRSRGVTIGDLNQQYYKRRYFSGGRVVEKGMNASKASSPKRKTTSLR